MIGHDLPSMTTDLTLETPDGEMGAAVARPNGGAKGGIVVVQEAFGVTPHIQSICDRLADAGYLAIAPAFFWRTGSPVLDYGDFEKVMPNMAAITAEGLANDVGAAISFLDGEGIAPTSRGIVGFCMGGTVSLWAGTAFEFGAAVTFYGGGVLEGRFGLPALVDAAPQLRCPWLGLFGDQDQGIPVDQVEALRDAAANAPVETAVHRYPEAGHGFNCDDRDAFHEASATDAWGRTLAWFDARLPG
jgi:carboxymethylenebutenolidase